MDDTPVGAVAAVRLQLDEFLDSFNNLDLDRFMQLWSEAPSVIHPFPNIPKRLSGWEEVHAGWSAIFDFMRASLPGPPYLRLYPLDVDVRSVGPGAVLATFHVDVSQALGRRTLLFERRDGAWKIVHLHASNIPRSLDH